MSASLLTGRDATLARWAASRIPHIGPDGFGECVAVGVATGEGPDDRLWATVVYHDFNTAHERCQVSAAAVDPRWASRATLRAVLAVPFMEYGLNRIWTVFPANLNRVSGFLKAIGFTGEGTLRDHFGKGVSGSVWRMHARDYERIYWAEKPEAKKAA